MTHVLIIILFSGSVSGFAAEFNNKTACEVAAEYYSQQAMVKSAVCWPKTKRLT